MSESRIAVVTGAARGMGLAITRALLEQGHHVCGADLDGATLEAAADELHEQGLSRPDCFVGDVSDFKTVDALFARIDREHGGVDALVNNAGTCFMTAFVDIEPDEFRRQMAINFDSAFYCCQRAIPLMLERPGVKKIVNISSNGAYNFNAFDPAHYRTSKAALDTLTKHLARQYARERICVNSIAPAMTRTDLFRVLEPEVLEKALEEMPHGRPMEPEEIAGWVAFLISPMGDCASGNVVILNQGRDVR